MTIISNKRGGNLCQFSVKSPFFHGGLVTGMAEMAEEVGNTDRIYSFIEPSLFYYVHFSIYKAKQVY